MGNGVSVPSKTSSISPEILVSSCEPSKFPNHSDVEIHQDFKQRYESEGYIPAPNIEKHIKLRYLLEDSVGMHALRKYGGNSENEVLLNCWVDVLSYTRSFVSVKSHNDGLRLFNKYLVNNAELSSCLVGAESLGGYHEQSIVTKIHQDEAVCKNHFSSQRCGNTCELSEDGFKWLLLKLFLAIDALIYTPILEKYPDFTMKLLSSISLRPKMGPSVTEYVFEGVLGEGSFGIVVLCKKIATGQKFAMKIQEKDEVIKNNASDTSKISSESVILADCSDSPYVVPLHFALQTNKLACLVLQYCPYGDLDGLLNNTPNKMFSNELSRFYICELVSVLGYLHGKGIIHRDLKPSNILLNMDGHILLTDFGAAHNGADFEMDKASDTATTPVERSISWRPSWFTGAGKNKYGPEWKKKKRRKRRKFALFHEKDAKSYMVSANAIVGTDGFMSPEVCYIHALPMTQRDIVMSYYNYTKAVDWWGVGAILFNFLTGQRAVSDAQMKQILLQYNFTGGALEYKKVIDLIGANNSNISMDGTENGPASNNSFNATNIASGTGSINRNCPIGGGVSKSSYGSPLESICIPENSPEAAILEAHPEIVIPQPADFETNGLSKDAIALLSSLLDVNFITRLGSGQYGTYNVKADKYFATVDWSKVDAKQCEPPSDSITKGYSVVNRLTNLVTGTKSRPDGKTESVGSTWVKRLVQYANTEQNSDSSHTDATSSFNCNFEKLLINIGKEHWIMTPLQLLNSSVSWGNNFSVQERKEFFSDWDYSNVECMLKEVGLSPVVS